MQVKARCQAVAPFGRLTKVLITWQKSPNFPEEQLHLNVLRDRVDFEAGDTLEFTLKKRNDDNGNI